MKITKYFLSMAAAVGMIAGCYTPEMLQISAPEDVTAPVLEEYEGAIEITPTNMASGAALFTWAPADYGVPTQVSYSLEAALESAADSRIEIATGLADTTKTATHNVTKVAYEKLNQVLFNDLKLNSGVAENVLFYIGAKLGEYEKIYSAPITVSCTVTAAEKVYPKLTVAGSYAYNSWTPGKGQFVFDFEGKDAQYSGVIDFGEDVSALEFKFVGEAWGNNEFSVPAGATQASEAAELALVAGGGDNIIAYRTHRFVSLTLDKTTPKVTKNFSFNQIGVIGSFNGWADDVVMSFNTEKQRFYADVEFTEDGQFKLRADADWANNWGAEAFGMTVSNGDGNLEVKAGKYRIYANMNNPAEMTIELVEGMYGKDEPVGGTTTPEPEPEPENPELPEGARAMNILCVNPGWEAANLYGWEAATTFSWPGVAATGKATLGGVEYFYWTLEAANWGKTPGLIFNNGTVQTVDITGVTLDGDKCFQLGEAGADGKLSYEAVDCPVLKITYKNEAGWDTVSMYGWGDLGDFGGWPGAAMTKEGDVWVYELPVEHLGKSTSLIFNNGGAGAQTVDLGPFTLTEDLVFDNSNAAIK